MEALGNLDQVYFVDLNKSEQPQKLPFSKEVSKANEICTKLTFILEECDKHGVTIKRCQGFKDFLGKKEELQRKMKMSKLTIIDHIDKVVKQQYNFLVEQTERIENMYNDYNDLLEYKKVIEVSGDLLHGGELRRLRRRLSSQSEREIPDSEERKSLMLRYMNSECESEAIQQDEQDGASDASAAFDTVSTGRVVGTCNNNDIMRLKCLIFRSTRGNALVLTRHEVGIETFDKKKLDKSVFIIIFQEGPQLRQKIETIAANFSKNKYILPQGNMDSKLRKINDRIEQTHQLISMTSLGLEKYLISCNEDCKIDLYHRI